LLYFWLSSPQLAQERVRTRVLEGGHFIAPEVIDRRYWLGITCLFDKYISLVDKAFIFDNSSGKPVLLAEKSADSLFISQSDLYHQLLNQYESRKTA
jgi:predicted ABC-type ATPase